VPSAWGARAGLHPRALGKRRDKVAAYARTRVPAITPYASAPRSPCSAEGTPRVSKRHGDADRSQNGAFDLEQSLGCEYRAEGLAPDILLVQCRNLFALEYGRLRKTAFSAPQPNVRWSFREARRARNHDDVRSEIVSDVGRYDQDRPKLIESGNVQLATPQAARARRSRQRGPRRPRIAGASSYVRRRATLERARESASSSARSSPRSAI
jgi:hypothetical protein